MGLFNWAKRQRTARSSDAFQSTDGITVHISNTGRVWVDPSEVVQTSAFQAQLAAVRRLRLAKEARQKRR